MSPLEPRRKVSELDGPVREAFVEEVIFELKMKYYLLSRRMGALRRVLWESQS